MLESLPVDCPHCGEPQFIVIDPSEGEHVRTEDCSVCCAPMEIVVAIGSDASWRVEVRRENE